MRKHLYISDHILSSEDVLHKHPMHLQRFYSSATAKTSGSFYKRPYASSP